MTRKVKNPEVLIEQGKQLIEFYRNNPCIAAYDLLRVDLAPIQRVVFEDMWFKNYVIAVCGRGFGKSQYIKSLTNFKDKGIVYLNEELPPIPSYLMDGDEEVIDWVDEIYTSEGYRKTSRLCLEKNIIGKRIETQNGFLNKGSNHHPILILDEGCNLSYKSLENLSIGDRVCIQRNQQSFGTNVVSEDDAYLIGLFIGDGSIGENHTPDISSEDQPIKDFCVKYCVSNNVSYRIDNDKRTKNTSKIVFKRFNVFFDKYGIERVLSYDKSVPYSIRTATKESQIAFLQGYFDTDGTVHNKNGGVSCCSVSKKLLSEIQIMLLNFGIVSRLREKRTNSKFGKAFLLDLFSEDAYKFKELIGFRLSRKQSILDKYFSNKKLNTNKDTIPYAKQLCWEIRKEFLKNNCSKYNDPIGKLLPFKASNKRCLSYYELNKFITKASEAEAFGHILNTPLLDKLKEILRYSYYFDTVVSVEDWKGDCYDFEMDMEGEPNYFSNGFINHNTFLLGTLAALSCLLYPGYRVGLIAPVFRQSKLIFAEIEKLYNKSPILREATEKKPIRQTDTCYLKFKSAGGRNGSYIESLPLGDGNKIRGSRFYLILIDELAQVPDQVLDMVVRPMGATSLEPMERVRRIEEQTRLIQSGVATAEDFEEESVNKMIMTSSGYYKFNHMWRRMKDHWKMMNRANEIGEESQYQVWQVPYWDLPPGFLDSNNIAEAKRIMTRAEFQMEYEAAMISDSEGFFKASLLEACTYGSNFGVEIHGSKDAKYILGVDPNQGGSASCGAVVIRMGDINKVVGAFELKAKKTQEMTQAVQEICRQYNIIRIFMDKGGGGKAICDLLEEGYGGYEPIIDRTNEDHRHLQGKHILEMVNFNPSWIADANFATKAMLEDQSLRFPETPLSANDQEAVIYETITELKKQMLSIIVRPTATGLLHFDTPVKGDNKDLYSAIILAAFGVRIVTKELEEDGDPILYNASGLMRTNKGTSNTSWDILNQRGPALSFNPKVSLSHAILKKKPK